MDEDERQVLEVLALAETMRRTDDGNYTSLAYTKFKAAGKPWPTVEAKPGLAQKWSALLGGVAPERREEAARAVQMEVAALKISGDLLSEDERRLAIPVVVSHFVALG